jgi:GAF domain-containing protein
MPDARVAFPLAEESQRLELLYHLSQKLAESLDLREVAARALDLITAHLGAYQGSLYLMEESQDQLSLFAFSNYTPPTQSLQWRIRPLLGQGLVGYAALTRQPELASGVSQNAHWVPLKGLDDWVRSAVAVPLLAGAELVGVMMLVSDRVNFFSVDDLPLLNAVAAPVAFALQNARLFEAERAARTQAEVLRELAGAVDTSLDREQVLQLILEQLVRVVEYDSASVMLVREGLLHVVAQRGRPPQARFAPSLRIENLPHVQTVLSTKRPQIAPDVQADPEWPVLPGHEATRCWLGVPLVARDEVLGLLSLNHQQPGFYGEHHARLTAAFASQAAIAICNAQLYAETQRGLLEHTLLYECSRELAQADTAQAALGVVAERMVAYLNATALCFYTYHEAERLIRNDFEYWSPQATAAEQQPVLGRTWALTDDYEHLVSALQTGTPMRLQRGDPALTFAERQMLSEWEGQSVLIIPMMVHGRALGYFEIWDSQAERRYDDADLRLLMVLANQTAVVLEKVRLFEETRRRDVILEALAYASEQLLSPGGLNDVLSGVLARLGRATGVSYALICENRLSPEGLLLFSLRYEWSAPGYLPTLQRPEFVGLSYAARGYERWVEIMGTGQPLFGLVRNFPENERAILSELNVKSLIRMPIFSSGTWWGYLGLDDSDQERDWSAAEIEALRNMANALGAALARQRSEAAEREQRLLAEALRDTAAALSGTLQFDEVLERVLANVGRVVPHDAAMLTLLEDGVARVIRSWGFAERGQAEWIMALQLRIADFPVFQRMVETGQPRVSIDKYLNLALPSDGQWIEAMITTSIVVRGEVIGFLNLCSETPGFFTSEHGDRLVTFANQAAIALENARLYDAIQQHAWETAALYRASAQLLKPGGDVASLARQIADTVTQEFAHTHCEVLLVDEAQVELRAVAQAGQFSTPLRTGVPLHAPGLTAAAFSLGQMIYAPDVLTDPRYLPGNPFTRSELVFPLRAHGHLIGVLDLQSPEPDAFDERTQRIVAAFAEHAALALENAQLVARLALARQLAEEANQLKSEFLANTSHELRTPLTGILGSLNIILEGLCDTPAEEREFLEVAYASSRNLLAIVNDVLDIAKIEAGKLEVELRAVDVAPILDEVWSLVRVQADKKSLNLQIQRPAEPVVVWADPDKVRQILVNLLGNALKFTERGGVTVSVRTEVEGGHAVIEVHDTGIGIPPEKQTKLFQPFVQADGSTTRKYGGTGLGLSISRRLTEMMHGSLTLFSAGVEQGSRFTLKLPLANGRASDRPG